MTVRVAIDRHREHVRRGERWARVKAAMRIRHEPSPWPVCPDYVPAHWEREAVR